MNIDTQEGKAEVIAELRARDARGEIGQELYWFEDTGLPCCITAHIVRLVDPDAIYVEDVERKIEVSMDIMIANDQKSPAAAIDLLAEFWQVQEPDTITTTRGNPS